MAAASERSLSPLLSVQREPSPLVMSDSDLSLIHDRIRHLGSQMNEIRLTILTHDGYVERRNREDNHIRREFAAHQSVCDRIDTNVTVLKTQVAQIESTLSQLNLKLVSTSKDTTSLRNDVSRLQENVIRLQVDVVSLKGQISGCVGEIMKLHTTVTHMQWDIKALQEQFSAMEKRLDRHVDDFTAFKNRMTEASAIRFNPLAYELNSFITPVPKVDKDGTLRYPTYFPETVWRFWQLKKPRKLNRLIQLAEFYELGGYQRWRTLDWYRAHLDDSDSGEDSDESNNLTRAEAIRRYPEACHRALAAVMGLDYRRIQKEISEASNHWSPRPAKRRADDMASKPDPRPTKKLEISQRYRDISPTFLQQLVRAAPSLKTKSSSSDHEDHVEYHDKWSEISEEKINNLKHGLPDDRDLLIRLIARGEVTVKPTIWDQIEKSLKESRREAARAAKAESPKESVRKEVIRSKEPSPEDDLPATQNTISTELITSLPAKEDSHVSDSQSDL